MLAAACAAALPALARRAGTDDPPPAAAAAAGRIAPGVNIAGVQVGGLARADARNLVLAQYVAPRRAKLPLTFRGRRLASTRSRSATPPTSTTRSTARCCSAAPSRCPPRASPSRCARA